MRHSPSWGVFCHLCRPTNWAWLPPVLQTVGWCGHHSCAIRGPNWAFCHPTGRSSTLLQVSTTAGHSRSNWTENHRNQSMPFVFRVEHMKSALSTLQVMLHHLHPPSKSGPCHRAVPLLSHSRAENANLMMVVFWWKPGEMQDQPPGSSRNQRAMPPGLWLNYWTYTNRNHWNQRQHPICCLQAGRWQKLSTMPDLPPESSLLSWVLPQLGHSRSNSRRTSQVHLGWCLVANQWRKLGEMRDRPQESCQHYMALRPRGHSPRNWNWTSSLLLDRCLLASRWRKPAQMKDPPPGSSQHHRGLQQFDRSPHNLIWISWTCFHQRLFRQVNGDCLPWCHWQIRQTTRPKSLFCRSFLPRLHGFSSTYHDMFLWSQLQCH